eukprot:jgi/Astpho2/278/Aster-02168
MEDVAFKLRIPQRKPWGGMTENVSRSQKLVAQRDKVMNGVAPADMPRAEEFLSNINLSLGKCLIAIDLKDADKVSIRTAEVLSNVAGLELLQAPGVSFIIPKEYRSLPQLKGRAVVDLTVERAASTQGFVLNAGGGPQRLAHMQLTVDGYSAPVTAGNFVVNVLDGFYDGKDIGVDYSSAYIGRGSSTGRLLPLEILPAGQFDPVYRLPISVSAFMLAGATKLLLEGHFDFKLTLAPAAGELPTLPLSIYGSLAMGHAPNGEDGSQSAEEWFIYKFDRGSSGLAGLSFDEGEFGVFGYVTGGSDVIPQLGTGDKVINAKVVSGADKLSR